MSKRSSLPSSSEGPNGQAKRAEHEVGWDSPKPVASPVCGEKQAADAEAENSRGQQPQPFVRHDPLPRPPMRDGFPGDGRRLPVKHKVQYAKAVTTCLAAICNQNQSIVTVADTKLSYGYTGTHARKIHGIHREWLVMWAGHASPCSQALDYARGHIDHLPKTAQQLTEIFIAACQRRPCTEDEDRWFLLAGFEQHIPHLYVLHDDATLSSATVRCCDDAGFAAIGSGSFVAEHMLTLFGPPQVRTEAEAVYTSCAAKFFTERATDVGVDTHTCVLRLDKYGVSYDLRVQSLVPKIRRAWETKGQVPIPASITRKIAKHLDIA